MISAPALRSLPLSRSWLTENLRHRANHAQFSTREELSCDDDLFWRPCSWQRSWRRRRWLKTKSSHPQAVTTSINWSRRLDNLGYELTSKNATTGQCSISISRATRSYTLHFAISGSKTNLWIQTVYGLTNVDEAAPDAVRRLLEENDIFGPARFGISSKTSLILEQPFGNREWTARKLRKAIEQFTALLDKVEPLVKSSNFLAAKAVPAEIVKPELARMQGEWRLVHSVELGKTSDAEQLQKADVRIHIEGNKLTSKKLPNAITFYIDPSHEPHRIDVTNDATGGVEEGIYKIEGNRLVLHLAKAGAPRPTDFSIESNDKLSVLILEKVN